MADALADWDISRRSDQRQVREFYSSPRRAGCRHRPPSASRAAGTALDTDREGGVIRSAEHAFSQDGGLAVLYGNIARDGCIVKTAGVDESILTFTGPARVFESQDDAVTAILTGQVVAGDVVVIRYEGPRGGPGMQEMLYPTSYLKSKGLGAACALLTDGRFSGGTSGLSHRPRHSRSGGGRHHRAGRGRRHDRHRHSCAEHRGLGARRDAGGATGGDGGAGRCGVATRQTAAPQGFRKPCRPMPP